MHNGRTRVEMGRLVAQPSADGNPQDLLCISAKRATAYRSYVDACTRLAHAASQPIDTANESLRSIIGATHKRCDKSFIRLVFFPLGRSNRLLERLSILALGQCYVLRSAAIECASPRARSRWRGTAVHTLRTRDVAKFLGERELWLRCGWC